MLENFGIDYKKVLDKLYGDRNVKPVRGNEDKMIRVAFDFFRLKDSDPETLWQVQKADDGQEYLMRTFSDDAEEKLKSESDWDVQLNKEATDISIYKSNVPIHRMDLNKMRIGREESEGFRAFIYGKLCRQDPEFLQKLAMEMPLTKISALKESGIIDLDEARTGAEWNKANYLLKKQAESNYFKDLAAETVEILLKYCAHINWIERFIGKGAEYRRLPSEKIYYSKNFQRAISEVKSLCSAIEKNRKIAWRYIWKARDILKKNHNTIYVGFKWLRDNDPNIVEGFDYHELNDIKDSFWRNFRYVKEEYDKWKQSRTTTPKIDDPANSISGKGINTKISTLKGSGIVDLNDARTKAEWCILKQADPIKEFDINEEDQYREAFGRFELNKYSRRRPGETMPTPKKKGETDEEHKKREDEESEKQRKKVEKTRGTKPGVKKITFKEKEAEWNVLTKRATSLPDKIYVKIPTFWRKRKNDTVGAWFFLMNTDGFRYHWTDKETGYRVFVDIDKSIKNVVLKSALKGDDRIFRPQNLKYVKYQILKRSDLSDTSAQQDMERQEKERDKTKKYLIARSNLKVGTIIEKKHLSQHYQRILDPPSTAIPIHKLESILGRKVLSFIHKGDFILLGELSKEKVQPKKRQYRGRGYWQEGATIADIQSILKREGLYTGIVDSKWGPQTRNAWNSFLKKYPKAMVEGLQVVNNRQVPPYKMLLWFRANYKQLKGEKEPKMEMTPQQFEHASKEIKKDIGKGVGAVGKGVNWLAQKLQPKKRTDVAKVPGVIPKGVPRKVHQDLVKGNVEEAERLQRIREIEEIRGQSADDQYKEAFRRLEIKKKSMG